MTDLINLTWVKHLDQSDRRLVCFLYSICHYYVDHLVDLDDCGSTLRITRLGASASNGDVFVPHVGKNLLVQQAILNDLQTQDALKSILNVTCEHLR